MSLYHSVTVNSDSEPVIVEVSNVAWKNAHNQRERRKKTIGFLFSLLVFSGCVAFVWTHKDQWKTRETKKIVRSKLFLEDFTTPPCTADLRVVGKFIDSVSSFLLEHHLDGVDINWEYPYNEDLPSQVTLISELREHLDITSTQKKSRAYLISLVTPTLGRTLENSIGKNLKNLLEFVNFVNVESFNYWKFWKNTTGPSTPLFSGVEPSVNDTISYYIKAAGTPEKLNLGLAFHGTYWNNVYKEYDSLSIFKPVDTNKGYMERGQVAWRNIEKNGSNQSWDMESRTPYIYDAEVKKFFSFDNPRSLKEKVDYAVDRMIGGLTIWSMEMDDDRGNLLGAVSSNLCENL